jgi:hypothetical protein
MDSEGNVKVSEGGVINADTVVGQVVNVGAPEDKSKPYKNIVLIVLGVAAIALVAVVLVRILVPAGPPPAATEILFDQSATMAQPFDGTTKMAAAMDSMKRILYEDTTDHGQLGLRTFGGPCMGSHTELTVPFHRDNADRIWNSLQQITPNGEHNTLVNAVTWAAEDLGGLNASRRRILVITGGDDGCGGDLQSIPGKIKANPSANQIQVRFRFIGLGLTQDQQRAVEEINRASGGEDPPIFVNNRKELNNAVQLVLKIEPVKLDAQDAVKILDTITEDLNKMVENENAKNYPQAEVHLKDAQNYFKSSSFPFQDLERRQKGAEFKEIHVLVSENRNLQESMIAEAEKALRARQSNNIDEENAAISRFNDLVNKANANLEKLRNVKLGPPSQ